MISVPVYYPYLRRFAPLVIITGVLALLLPFCRQNEPEGPITIIPFASGDEE